ncbi:MAG: tetratricopeptide repeat protein [Chitinophagaceae bacterium]|nr:tetratricopeptide repeat protein [Chitinophagaceae bacterium]MBK8951961.1 tetratricopeptide repeat protein [Chitinophagaceae bacterium]
MRKLIITGWMLLFLAELNVIAQNDFSFTRVDSLSYSLYEKTDWRGLLRYGKEAIANRQDFLLLRLRLGYAAFMLKNYSESIKHYEAALKEDSYNSTAHYFIYWSRINLNQSEIAMAEVKFLTSGVLPENKYKPFALSGAEVELSFKQPDSASRGKPIYARIGLGNRFSHSFHMQQSLATFQQTLNEPLFTAVSNNNKINIGQVEYYNRMTININRRLQFKVAYHYLHTPFNNFTYQNHLLMTGVKYNGSYFDVQADAVFGRLTDTSTSQYNLQLGLYPLGNLDFYSYSTASMRQRQGSAFNFRQVLGAKMLKNTWLEGNITLGRFQNLAENDAIYVYNSVDPTKMKAGITGYLMFGGKTIAQLGYTFEQRQLFGTTTTYNQHSITGGLSWKF